MEEQAAWAKVLENVQQALERAEAETAKREQELAAVLPEAAENDPAGAWPGCFERVDARMQGLRSQTEQAGHSAAEADTALAEAEVGLREWLANAERSEKRLANWAAP